MLLILEIGMKLAYLFTLLSLLGCQSGVDRFAPPFTELELLTPQTIAGGQATAYFKSPNPSNQVGTHNITCGISVNNISDGYDVIEADTFTVTGYYAQRERNDYSGTRLSSPFECVNPYYNASYFKLHSDKQPQVRQLVCRELLNSCNGFHYFTYDDLQVVFEGKAELK